MVDIDYLCDHCCWYHCYAHYCWPYQQGTTNNFDYRHYLYLILPTYIVVLFLAYDLYPFKTTYFGSLTSNSASYNRGGRGIGYYYQVIRLVIASGGYYQIKSVSNIDMYGYLYKQWFNATNTNANYLQENDDSGGSVQFLFTIYFSPGNYTLVATTYSPYIVGSFSIIAAGYNNYATLV